MEHQPTGMNDPNNHRQQHSNPQAVASSSSSNNGVTGISDVEQMIASASAGRQQQPETTTTATTTTNRRKKSKSRPQQPQHPAPPNTARSPPALDPQALNKHLDDWLDSCLRDAPLTSSSSEFLDQQPQSHPAQQQQLPQQPHSGNFHLGRRSLGIGNSASATAAASAMAGSSAASSSAVAAQMYAAAAAAAAAASAANGGSNGNGIGGNARMFGGLGGGGAGVGGPRPLDTPTRGSSHSGIHDSFGNYQQKYSPMYPANYAGLPNFGSGHALNAMMPSAGGMLHAGSNYMNGSRQSNLNSDFSSLPPAVNMMNQGKDLRLDAQDILEGLEHRHFSDPCLAGASDDSKDSGNGPTTTTNRSPNSNSKTNSGGGSGNESTKMLSTILEQIGALHDTNTKIYRSLHENKVDIEALKHAPNWGLRHRRDSISGLSTHSQPLGYAAAFGTHSPAPTFHSGIYTPGMLTDVVREVKDAARVREDALLSRVKALVEERSWMMNDSNCKLSRELDDLKSQIGQLKSERTEMRSHMDKMDDELKSMRTLLTHCLQTNNQSVHQPQHASPSNLPYHNGVQLSPGQFFGDRSVGSQQQQQQQQQNLQQQQRQRRPSMNLSYGTINSNSGGTNQDDHDGHVHYSGLGLADEDNSGNGAQPEAQFAANGGGRYSTMDERIAQICRDNVDLRSDLSCALESRKEAESKITSLENMVMKLQTSISQHVDPSAQHEHAQSASASGKHHHQQLHSHQPMQLHQANTNNNNINYAHSNNSSTHHSSRNSSFSEAHTSSSASTVMKQQQQPATVDRIGHKATSNNSSNNNTTTISLIGPVTDL